MAKALLKTGQDHKYQHSYSCGGEHQMQENRTLPALVIKCLQCPLGKQLQEMSLSSENEQKPKLVFLRQNRSKST